MKALLQRVRQARVEVDGQVVGQIDVGLLVLLCAEPDDTEATGERLLAKILKLRIFGDEAAGAGPPQGGCFTPSGGGAAHEVASQGANRSGKMNRSVQDVGGGLLVVSQFTLAADVRGGNRPSFTAAAPPQLGKRLYDAFVAQARVLHPQVQTGIFGADMQVHLVNDGPVTLPIDMR